MNVVGSELAQRPAHLGDDRHNPGNVTKILLGDLLDRLVASTAALVASAHRRLSGGGEGDALVIGAAVMLDAEQGVRR